jgi:hypothetical protein
MTGISSQPERGALVPRGDAREPTRDGTRPGKFRQAAFVYLHVAILYEVAAYSMWKTGLLPERFGAPLLWLLAGAIVAGLIFAGLYWWQNVWMARVVWLVHGLRLPALVEGAFLRGDEGRIAPSFYLLAIIVVVVNLWMLARAAWDL